MGTAKGQAYRANGLGAREPVLKPHTAKSPGTGSFQVASRVRASRYKRDWGSPFREIGGMGWSRCPP